MNLSHHNRAELEAEATRCCRDDWCDSHNDGETFAKWNAIAAMLQRCAAKILVENNRQHSLAQDRKIRRDNARRAA